MSNLNVKVYYFGEAQSKKCLEIRRFKIHAQTTFRYFVTLVTVHSHAASSRFSDFATATTTTADHQQQQTASYIVQYLDDENDYVSVGAADEWIEALANHTRSTTLRVRIYHNTTTTTNNKQDEQEKRAKKFRDVVGPYFETLLKKGITITVETDDNRTKDVTLNTHQIRSLIRSGGQDDSGLAGMLIKLLGNPNARKLLDVIPTLAEADAKSTHSERMNTSSSTTTSKDAVPKTNPNTWTLDVDLDDLNAVSFYKGIPTDSVNKQVKAETTVQPKKEKAETTVQPKKDKAKKDKNVRFLYGVQLKQLNDMGFNNSHVLEMLYKHRGNVNRVVADCLGFQL